MTQTSQAAKEEQNRIMHLRYLIRKEKNYYDMIKSDIFSLGAAMLSLATGYRKNIEYLMIRFIDKCLREFNRDKAEYYLKISDELTDLIMNMCNLHPDERMTIKEIYEDKWVKKRTT